MIWISKSLIQEMMAVEIGTNDWADHSPIKLEWRGQMQRRSRWRINTQTIKEKDYKEMIEKELKWFFMVNNKDQTSLQNLWDTTKAFIRGITISYVSRRKKDKEKQYRELLEEIRKWEGKLQEQPLEESYRANWWAAKHKINLQDQENYITSLKHVKQNYFEHANKPGRWMAYRLRKDREKRIIHQLQDKEGNVHKDLDKKKYIATQYFQELYTQEIVPSEEIKQYLDRNGVPEVSREERELLTRKITKEELSEIMKKQKNNKTPGTDGIPMEFYKQVGEILNETLLEVLNEALLEAKIPESWREACITLIPKEEADTTQIQNYRPISLLNTDYKIFTSLLANRIKMIISRRIHSDQNGFLPARQIKNNTRTVLNIIEYYELHPEKPVALIFLDAQKAFDRVNWSYMTQQIRNMKLGDQFSDLIEVIYKKQKARITINGEQTDFFEIGRGVRQGCPLSPLLFILTLESLLRKIRKNKSIKGLMIKGEEYKVQAFADDLVFFVEDPATTGGYLLQEIEEFGRVAGLKMNRNKTKMLTKNITNEDIIELEHQLGIEVVKKVKYLGINLTNKNLAIKKNNYDKLITQIGKDLDRWGKLKLSLLGRIAAVKMNILPRLLYLFQTIPVKLEKSFFTQLNKITSKFVWDGRKPRIGLKILQDDKLRGGFGLPAWETYYKASCLVWIKDWVSLANQRVLKLEGHDLLKGWHFFLWNSGNKLFQYFKNHVIRNSLIGIWLELKRKHYMNTPTWISPLEAIKWPNKLIPDRITRYKELLDSKGDLKSRPELQSLGIELDWWTYLQLQNKYKEDRKGGFGLIPNQLDKLLIGNEIKLIARLYKYLLEYDLAENLVKGQMIAWARNIGRNILLEDWEKIWEINIKMTRSVAFKENQFKMWYRWYLPPARLAKMYPNLNANCWKCRQAKGTFYHTWWLCPKIKKYWEKIKLWIQQITQVTIKLEPEVFLLGIIKQNIRKEIRYLILHIITAARMALAQNWKSDKLPADLQIIQKIYQCAEMDQLTLKLNDKDDSKYFKVWENWYNWIKFKKYG